MAIYEAESETPPDTESASNLILYLPASKTGKYISVVGETYGKITDREIGDTSFCYDCLFLSDDLKKTFGEATEEEKNLVSHRGRAVAKLIEEIKNTSL